MPIIIAGYVTVSAEALRAHRGHDIGIADTDPRVIPGPTRIALHCDACGVVLMTEPEPDTSLPCGCRDKADHVEGVALQEKYGKDQRGRRLPDSTCVGCYIGDDGPSVHSCAIHDRRYWA